MVPGGVSPLVSEIFDTVAVQMAVRQWGAACVKRAATRLLTRVFCADWFQNCCGTIGHGNCLNTNLNDTRFGFLPRQALRIIGSRTANGAAFASKSRKLERLKCVEQQQCQSTNPKYSAKHLQLGLCADSNFLQRIRTHCCKSRESTLLI